MPTWPDTLPQQVGWQSYQESTQQGATLRSQPDAGPYKSRPRFSASADPFSVVLPRLTSDQVTTLKNFYKSDCANGSLGFDWQHPRTGEAAVLVFAGEITFAGVDRNRFSAAFDMVILP